MLFQVRIPVEQSEDKAPEKVTLCRCPKLIQGPTYSVVILKTGYTMLRTPLSQFQWLNHSQEAPALYN